jgi:hypothetical protein
MTVTVTDKLDDPRTPSLHDKLLEQCTKTAEPHDASICVIRHYTNSCERQAFSGQLSLEIKNRKDKKILTE